MDRNLGAPDVNYHGNGTGSVYYQFGRKDPFEGGTLYKPDGSSISISNIAWNSDVITTKSSEKGKNVPYSIQNPLKFITNSGPWTTGDQYCPADGRNIIWQDPKSLSSTDGRLKKSIFDPCPSGWMVPMIGTLSGSLTSVSTTLANGIGRYYYPAGTERPGIYAFFPASGFYKSDGAFEYVNEGNYIMLWSCSPSTANGFSMRYYYDTKPSETPFVRAQGFSVRCIQEYF